MTEPSELSRAELEEIVGQIQGLLWLDLVADEETWNPDKEWNWDWDTLEYMAGVLEEAGLRPDREGRADV
jgi:hypothetical protein